MFFGVLIGVPRGSDEEGGPLGVHSVRLGEFMGTPLCDWGDLLSKSIWEDKLFYLRTVVRDELFGLRTTS
jgi:hypothetical protein